MRIRLKCVFYFIKSMFWLDRKYFEVFLVFRIKIDNFPTVHRTESWDTDSRQAEDSWDYIPCFLALQKQRNKKDQSRRRLLSSLSQEISADRRRKSIDHKTWVTIHHCQKWTPFRKKKCRDLKNAFTNWIWIGQGQLVLENLCLCQNSKKIHWLREW